MKYIFQQVYITPCRYVSVKHTKVLISNKHRYHRVGVGYWIFNRRSIPIQYFIMIHLSGVHLITFKYAKAGGVHLIYVLISVTN